jgi:hypothetical protein
MSFFWGGSVLKIIDIAGKSKLERELHFGGEKRGMGLPIFRYLSP